MCLVLRMLILNVLLKGEFTKETGCLLNDYRENLMDLSDSSPEAKGVGHVMQLLKPGHLFLPFSKTVS